jgi:hypothetical protein
MAALWDLSQFAASLVDIAMCQYNTKKSYSVELSRVDDDKHASGRPQFATAVSLSGETTTEAVAKERRGLSVAAVPTLSSEPRAVENIGFVQVNGAIALVVTSSMQGHGNFSACTSRSRQGHSWHKGATSDFLQKASRGSKKYGKSTHTLARTEHRAVQVSRKLQQKRPEGGWPSDQLVFEAHQAA